MGEKLARDRLVPIGSGHLLKMENATHDPEADATRIGSQQIESVCDAFERGLHCERPAAIENQLVGWEEPERSKLLYELIRLEIEHFQRNGEEARPEDYLRRFPRDRLVIDEAFQSIASIATVPMSTSGETLIIHSVLGDLKFHDKGGLGIVYVAEDQKLQRNTVVKFLQENLTGDPRAREQFLLEAEITGRLEHPGVVPIYGLGESSDGRLFYAMRLIHGETMETAVARFHRSRDAKGAGAGERQIGFRDLLGRFVSVCKTVAYAHNRGVIHRDLKPSNIMLGRYGETIVIDWGLATPVGRKGVFKDSGENTLMPSSGSDPSHVSGGGTPPYMSPEQADVTREVGPAGDVYGLGATLYSLLTGQPPFKGSVKEILEKVARGEFPRPTHVSRHVSRALEAVCLKAMSLAPGDRYSTALELAEDVDRYLADAPVLAYKEPFARRWARWARRHRVLAQGLLVTLAALTVMATLSSLWLGRQAQREKRLHAVAERARRNEQHLRERGLLLSAQFAARTIANQIDIRWRILEKEAADGELHTLLTNVNRNPQDGQLRGALQQWFDTRILQDYTDVPSRSWFIQSYDGTQVARFPSHDDNNQPFASLGQNFAFRDYYHGQTEDFLPDRMPKHIQPLPTVHLATIHRSTNGGDLSATFSAPIGTSGADPLGVLGMSIEVGSFADLKISLPEEQSVLLVDTRKYFLLSDDRDKRADSGEGLVLHHKDLQAALKRATVPGRLPHLEPRYVTYMQEKKEQQDADAAGGLFPLEYEYRDPLRRDPPSSWIAAFAPVLVKGRPAEQHDTGWFVIVQQPHQLVVNPVVARTLAPSNELVGGKYPRVDSKH